jgi:UPF0042 nucleotide-binding protein
MEAPERSDGTAVDRIVLVTGMSGAGRSSALKILEDMGYEAVDNLPLSLLASILRGRAAGARPLAVGVDIRTRDFGVEPFIDELDRLSGDPALAVRTLFLDCADEVLVRRYAETRRRHPLDADRPVPDVIKLERRLLERLRERADLVVDTTDNTPWDLKGRLARTFALEDAPGMGVFVTSFSYRRGVPREADLVFDVRFLTNPHYDPRLQPLSGEDQRVAETIAADPDFPAFFERLTAMLELLLPRYAREGKSYLTIAVGCTGGRHRSVFVGARLARWLEDKGWTVYLLHRDIGGGSGQDMI